MESEKETKENSRMNGFSLNVPAYYKPHEKMINPEYLTVWENRIRHVLAFDSIVRLQAQGQYTHIYYGERRYMTCKKIGDYENVLCPWGFCRIHRSHMVNMKHIVRFEDKKRFCVIILKDESEMKVAYKYRTEFMQRFWGFCLATRRSHDDF